MLVKKILIGSEDGDATTYEVCKWIDYYGGKYIVINNQDNVEVSYVHINNHDIDIVFKQNNIVFKLSELKSFWYRRGGLSVMPANIVFDKGLETSDMGRNILKRFVHSEMNRIESFYRFLFENNKDVKLLGNPTSSTNNKLIHFIIAKNNGIKIPESHIVTNANALRQILKNTSKKFVIKPISDAPAIHNELTKDRSDFHMLYTSEITTDDLASLPDRFPPSLVQEKIEKKYEIRIFFMYDDYYPMAIFSQTDIKTGLDYRRYNHASPNRYVPIKVSDKLLKKLRSFAFDCKLNTGSFDIIYSSDDEYYFLEVNPVGQLGMVSFPCNFYIEKKIAEFLHF